MCALQPSRIRLSLMTQPIAHLPPEVFEALLNTLVKALAADYRQQWVQRREVADPATTLLTPATWMTVAEAASRAHCHVATLRREVRAGRLRVAKIGGRKALRFRAEWIDEWLQASVPM